MIDAALWISTRLSVLKIDAFCETSSVWRQRLSMAGQRKRKRPGRECHEGEKRRRVSGDFSANDPFIKSAVLAQYYPEVFSLREYLLSRLPASSKIRRKKISSVGKNPQLSKEEDELAGLLDQTLVGVSKYKEISQEERLQQWSTFSQRVETSDSNIGNTNTVGKFSQLEVCQSCLRVFPSKIL